jgi:hypothetical protein
MTPHRDATGFVSRAIERLVERPARETLNDRTSAAEITSSSSRGTSKRPVNGSSRPIVCRRARDTSLVM